MGIRLPIVVVSCLAVASVERASLGAGPCPSIAIPTHAEVAFTPSLKAVGRYDLQLEVGGKTEACVLDVRTVVPARAVGDMVRGPMTDATTTCALASISGLKDDGGLAGLSFGGTPARISVKVSVGGRVLGGRLFAPDYTPDRCGFVHPVMALPLAP